MSVHVPFVVVAEMSGAIVLNDILHLDGVLLAAREKRDGIGARGTPFDALAQRDGFFQASAGALVCDSISGVVERPLTRIRRIDMKSCAHLIEIPEDATKDERTIGTMSPYRNMMSQDPILSNVSQVVFQALGDRDEVEDLLSYVDTLGKMHRTGWGAVARFDIHECNAAADLCGISVDGLPLRNVPAELAPRYGIASEEEREGRIEPPYASAAGRTRIVGPTLQQMTFCEEEARRVLAY